MIPITGGTDSYLSILSISSGDSRFRGFFPITRLYHVTCWIRYCPRRRSWPDFVWSLSLPRLAISFNHMHSLSPVHFSSSHSRLAFSTFVLVFLFLYYLSLQISKPSLLHFHLLSSKHDRTTVNYLL